MKYLFLLFFACLTPLSILGQIPSTEVRAVWLATNWGLDWPTQGSSVASQKAQLCADLDELAAANFNTVLFQTRAQGDVFYRSAIEPLSPFFNHAEGFDPLAFAVAECHKRGLECHAWIVTYPVQKADIQRKATRWTKASYKQDKPYYYKLIDDRWYLDPGYPQTRTHIQSLVKEIVANYDIDGIHFDYIRYPSNTSTFPDQDTYQLYGNGMTLADWRRANITKLVFNVYDEVKAAKKWVQVSSSPLGRYKAIDAVNVNDGWNAYTTVYQDAGYWMRSGMHDLLFPMMYHRGQLFYPFVDDWLANVGGRIVVPGLGAYLMASNEQDWDVLELVNQLDYTRKTGVGGQAFFRTKNVLDNLKGIKDKLATYYPYPAKLPPLTWLQSTLPAPPLNMEAERQADGTIQLQWEAPSNTQDYTYTIYMSPYNEVDVNDASSILATGLHSTTFSFAIEGASQTNYAFYYSITASDRYHNESLPCVSAFVVHWPRVE